MASIASSSELQVITFQTFFIREAGVTQAHIAIHNWDFTCDIKKKKKCSMFHEREKMCDVLKYFLNMSKYKGPSRNTGKPIFHRIIR